MPEDVDEDEVDALVELEEVDALVDFAAAAALLVLEAAADELALLQSSVVAAATNPAMERIEMAANFIVLEYREREG